MTAVCVLLLACVCGCLGAPVSWTQMTTTTGPPPARWNAGLAVISGTGYLFGGEGTPASGVLGDTWTFTTSGSDVSWTLVNGVGPSPRYSFVSGVVENRYWIISHGCDVDTCFSDTWSLDSMTNTWSLLVNSSTQTAPRGRATRAGGVYPGSNMLWLSMGENKASMSRKFSDTWVLRVNTSIPDQLTAEWEEVSPGGGLDQYNPFSPHARSLHAGTPISPDTFAIVGGCATGGQVGGPCPLNDGWTISISDRTWQQQPPCPLGRTRAVLAPIPGFEGNGYLLGGSESWGPGVFSSQLTLTEVNTSQLVLMTTTNSTPSNWLTLEVDSGSFPDNLDNPSVAIDNNVLLYFGGRRLEDGAFQNIMWMLSGDGLDQTDLGCPQEQYTYVHLHGTLMYAAWGLFFPLGVLLGRYYRWTWPCWFVFHVIFQCLGVLVTVAGFVVIFLVGGYSEPNFPHAIIGIVLTGLMIQQFLSGIFHPCVSKENGNIPPDEKSAYRKCWEIYHAISGFLSVAIGLGQVTLGVFLINAPLIVWAIWVGLGGVWLLVFLIHECAYICYKIVNRGQKVY